MTSVWSLALRLWAAVPCLMAYPLARLGTRLQWQLTPPRIWAIYLLLSGLALLAGLLTSLVLHRLGLVPAPSHGRA
ncbi:MAG: hypothetical protein VKP62_12580, partial [Candidatus Sericytochromatia bacterium]|nr:hypothetical protein [Candidatus Sericytochromatia bacterium]